MSVALTVEVKQSDAGGDAHGIGQIFIAQQHVEQHGKGGDDNNARQQDQRIDEQIARRRNRRVALVKLQADGDKRDRRNEREVEQHGRQELREQQRIVRRGRAPQERLNSQFTITVHRFARVEDRETEQKEQQRLCRAARVSGGV